MLKTTSKNPEHSLSFVLSPFFSSDKLKTNFIRAQKSLV
ncbi:hypothetical protein C1G86_1110 [Dehalococcoides mccartyi]|uniref:Uncharacterized protein n=1 Tax=Dehalococcoides mccartyi TaxID=61435 RepID=A0A142VB40_9CHLR|nr:hypothetical protein Dm11a5_1053 [Dehalococcoides mccartyi]AOV99667.1 hypothetical protein DCWBC2_1042 [Dehalococcoides mccartyi]MBA2085448.1 hypothetical protein [Dehalococcoides mccartyi]RAL70237.1 hypothetical protein C1G86_1110 [Dehalococcoides mccartyi]